MSELPLSKHQIELLIPHAGSMCLLDRVDDWNQSSIRCASNSHQDLDNPLRFDGQLTSLHLLEYGAQAMAIHGGLLTKTANPGMLVAIRDVKVFIDNLDQITGEIIIQANAEINTDTAASYHFNITDMHGRELLSGRATVINN